MQVIANERKSATQLLIFCLSALGASLTLSNPVRAAETVVDKIFEVEVSGGKSITCGGPLKGKYISGKTREVSNAIFFIPASDQAKSIQKQIKTAAGSKKDKLKKKLTKLNTKIRNENRNCDDEMKNPPSTNPGNQPTPTPIRTSTPRPAGNFDSNGNVTAQGKVLFGIPSYLSANSETGRSLYNANCKGCHDEKIGFNFSYYKARIQLSPMFILNKTDQEMAHITAFLRRFETE